MAFSGFFCADFVAKSFFQLAGEVPAGFGSRRTRCMDSRKCEGCLAMEPYAREAPAVRMMHVFSSGRSGMSPPPRRPCSATNRRNAQYLDFLCVLCLCEGAPITRNQDVICQQLLKKKAHVLLPMQRQQGQVCGPRPLLGRESRIGNQAFFLHHPNSTAKVNSTVKGLCPPSSFINRLSQPPAQSLDQPIGCGDGVCVWVAVMCWPKVG